MTAAAEAIELRRRAHHLRSVAEAIEHTPATTLGQHAGVDTWRGPAPDLCRILLTANLHQLHGAAEDLRHRAHGLDQRAGELESEALLALGEVR
jgi:hypothetical protein